MAVDRHALTQGLKGQRSHGYKNCHGRMTASEVCYCDRCATN